MKRLDRYQEHRRKCERLLSDLAAARAKGGPIRLRKSTSNLFRPRGPDHAHTLDVSRFTQVLRIDVRSATADVEGMIPYDALADATLRHGFLPAVVPQLKSITVGGAVSGVGIESSSFRYGLVHETVEDMDILLADGQIVRCSRDSNSDLFFGFANSYGTLGYALRVKIRMIPARRFVRLNHTRFSEPGAYFARIAEVCESRTADYVDGAVFDANEMFATEAVFSDEAPHVSDYTWMNIYYRSIRRRTEDWLTARGYIWRWDTDWFWCSKQFYAQNPAVRLIATPLLLNSRTWQRIMRCAQRALPDRGGTESVIQDVDIEVGRAPEFLRFLLAEIGIAPVWICPFRGGGENPLYAFEPGKLYINFGFWDVIPSSREPGYFNRRVEQKLLELGGKKGLYSSVRFDEETFWRLYGKAAYDELKARYDPDRVLPDLYSKCSGRPRAQAAYSGESKPK